MKTEKKVIFFTSLLLLFVVLTGCQGSDYQRSVYDDNDKIAGQGDSYTFIKRLGGVDSATADLEFDTFYGMQTLWTLDASEGGTVSVNYDNTVKSGKFKAVLITPENEVINIFEGDGGGDKIIDIPEGENRIKIVGYDAKGKTSIYFQDYENINIKASAE